MQHFAHALLLCSLCMGSLTNSLPLCVRDNTVTIVAKSDPDTFLVAAATSEDPNTGVAADELRAGPMMTITLPFLASRLDEISQQVEGIDDQVVDVSTELQEANSKIDVLRFMVLGSTAQLLVNMHIIRLELERFESKFDIIAPTF